MTAKTAIAQRSRRQMRFSHRGMDYYYSWILGRQVYGGSDAAECAQAADHIGDGDPDSWEHAWLDLAERVDQQAQTALVSSEREEARRAYLRACTYYRAPLFVMYPEEDTAPCQTFFYLTTDSSLPVTASATSRIPLLYRRTAPRSTCACRSSLRDPMAFET